MVNSCQQRPQSDIDKDNPGRWLLEPSARVAVWETQGNRKKTDPLCWVGKGPIFSPMEKVAFADVSLACHCPVHSKSMMSLSPSVLSKSWENSFFLL